MTFTSGQKQALEAPLNSANVKTRSQSGRTLSYVEGWHAIAEANRIFGFDAWSRETIDLRCVCEKEREVGAQKNKGWGVTYTARVRIQIGDVIRDGSGTGHGIDRDLGQAHESALKEAETDAMKRALMTFGNQFGLALYDKTQAHVVDEPVRQNPHVTQPRDVNEFEHRVNANGEQIDYIPVDSHRVEKLRVVDARPVAETLLAAMRLCKSPEELAGWGEDNAETFAQLPDKWISIYQGEYQKLLDDLRANRKAA